MSYKWKPSKSARREFAQNMKDPEFERAYYDRKEQAAKKRRSTSNFDYQTAGGNYVPTKIQYDFCMDHLKLFVSPEEKTAMNEVIYGYGCVEKIHHDNIHIVNEKIRCYKTC